MNIKFRSIQETMLMIHHNFIYQMRATLLTKRSEGQGKREKKGKEKKMEFSPVRNNTSKTGRRRTSPLMLTLNYWTLINFIDLLDWPIENLVWQKGNVSKLYFDDFCSLLTNIITHSHGKTNLPVDRGKTNCLLAIQAKDLLSASINRCADHLRWLYCRSDKCASF